MSVFSSLFVPETSDVRVAPPPIGGGLNGAYLRALRAFRALQPGRRGLRSLPTELLAKILVLVPELFDVEPHNWRFSTLERSGAVPFHAQDCVASLESKRPCYLQARHTLIQRNLVVAVFGIPFGGLTPRLKEMHVPRLGRDPPISRIVMGTPPTLPLLSEIDIIADTESGSCLLTLLHMPALRVLRFKVADDQDNAFDGLLGHSWRIGSQITTLALQVSLPTAQLFRDCFDVFPNVESFDARGINFGFWGLFARRRDALASRVENLARRFLG
ncbi:hypothetical protein R3P38DRAFT_2810709 [Favolaschia claudopus]|uniref:F-box domain-containing protein n=1 Tax=Favolaschia claudopus TaxID=2862362 RepID=A0AAV9ZA43_9AGAR